MRDIRFRAWDKNKGKMILNAHNKHDFVDWTSENSPYRYSVDLMQYTGLKDKNGAPIFESDLVKDDIDRIWEVYYDDDMAWFWWKNECSDEKVLGEWNCSDDPAYPCWDRCEVIGNRYQNPELIAK